MLLFDHRTAYAIDAKVLLHRSTVSNVMFARSLVLVMLPTTWWIIFKIAFACEFFIALHISLTEKYLRNGIKSLLNSEPLLEITLCGLGFLDSLTSLNNWDILDEDWSMIGTSTISNHPVAWSIKGVHNNWSSFVSILLSVFMTLASIVYVPMKSTHTVCHVVNVSASLAGSNPYLALYFLISDSIYRLCRVSVLVQLYPTTYKC